MFVTSLILLVASILILKVVDVKGGEILSEERLERARTRAFGASVLIAVVAMFSAVIEVLQLLPLK